MRFPHKGLWSLSPDELAGQCREVGYGTAAGDDLQLRDEAKMLCLAWAEVLGDVREDAGSATQKAVRVAALRRRTFAILSRNRN